MSDRTGDIVVMIFMLCIGLGFAGVGLWLGAKICRPLYRMLGRRMLWLGVAALVVLSFLWPPYNILRDRFGATAFGGYAWLWDLPALKEGVVAWPLLLVEWVAITLVTGLLWLAFKD